ncbi:MAG: alpha/beta hydrolase [Amphritea sp.]
MPTMMVDGKEMHYLDQGEGFSLLFGHSYLWDCRMWMPQINILSQHFRCIVPDLWGHGRSYPVVSDELNIGMIAESNRKLMQQLEIDRYSIIGLSVGAMWGAKLAMDYPNEVASLVMMGSYLGAEHEENAAEYAHLLDIVKQMKEVPPAIIDVVSRLFFCSFTEERNPALVETFRFDLMSLLPEQVSSIVVMGDAIFQRASMLERIRDIRCPTLFVVGEGDLARPVSESQEMHELLPDSQLAIIENAGHITNLEQPDQVNQLLANFLTGFDRTKSNLNELVLT